MASGRIHVCLATLFALGLGGAARSGADEVTINGLNVEKTITCDHRDVVIHGTNHRLTLKGRCRQVWVDGTGHLVHVEALGSADVAGVNNRIEWERALRGEEPVARRRAAPLQIAADVGQCEHDEEGENEQFFAFHKAAVWLAGRNWVRSCPPAHPILEFGIETAPENP